MCCPFLYYPTNVRVCKSVRKPDNKTLHTRKNETVTFTAGGTGLTSTSPHRNTIFIIVGSGISALGLSTRYIQISKNAYVGMTDKGIFYNTDIADEKLTPQKSRSPKTIPLRASSGIPLSMACFALPPFTVHLSIFTGISYVVT